jgi:hypothetical protein
MILRTLLAALALFLAGTIVWAFMKAPFWESFALIAAMPWGWVSLIDLYLGFFVFSCLVIFLEKDPKIAFALILALFLLGNVVSALWLALRGWRRLIVIPDKN